MERYRPQVVVTYDANGFYGHPDHIMAHRITVAAAASTGIPAKVYETAVPRSGLKEFAAAMLAEGIAPPELSDREEGQFHVDEGEGPVFGTPDEQVTTYIDVHDQVSAKRASLAAHASQADNIFFLGLSEVLYGRFFGVETFVRTLDRTGAPLPESDLFAGLRS
jgi:LmbE family N-acetylglucosaminyl deacetylase